eukprot:7634350-Lingulodinium_polyedra.AAC.1
MWSAERNAVEGASDGHRGAAPPRAIRTAQRTYIVHSVSRASSRAQCGSAACPDCSVAGCR